MKIIPMTIITTIEPKTMIKSQVSILCMISITIIFIIKTRGITHDKDGDTTDSPAKTEKA